MGLDEAMIHRIYSCLFVYSYGFHMLLRECSAAKIHKDFPVASRVWKAFSVLIEVTDPYLSNTTIGELTKGYESQLEELRTALNLSIQEQERAELATSARIHEVEKNTL